MKIPATTHSIQWRPPPTGWLKVNFNGAIFSYENIAVLGVTNSNEDELVMQLCHNKFYCIP